VNPLERGIALGTIALSGCAGGSPLLHPAHVLAAGDVRVMAGMSGEAAVGQLSSDLNSSYDQASKGESTTTPAYAKGALVAATVAPGLAPFGAARVGIGGGAEGGVAYTGHGGRLDLRRAFSNRSFALSIGAGFDAAFIGRPTNASLPDVQLGALYAFGFDVPVLVGWRSTAGLYQAWAGVRGGYDHATITARSTEPVPPGTGTVPYVPFDLSADHGHVGGLLGIAVGLHHIHVALELDVAYHFVTGTFAGNNVSTSGVVITPASALLWDF